MIKSTLAPSALVVACGLLTLSQAGRAETVVAPISMPVSDAAVVSAQQALAQNHPDQAISALTTYTAGHASDPTAFRILAEAYLASNMPGKAIKSAETAVKLAMDPQEKAKCDLVAGDAYIAAVKQLRSGNGSSSQPDAAETHGDERIHTDISGGGSDTGVHSDEHYHTADATDAAAEMPDDSSKDILSKSEKSYSAANKLSPDIGNVHNQLGLADLIDGNTDDAKSEFETQLKKAGPLPETYYWLGQIDTAGGDTDSAIKSYQSALSLDPNDPAVYSALVKIYQKAKKPAEASWAEGMADVYSGDLTGAQTAFDKAGDPTPGVLRGRAALAVANQQPDAAKDFIAKAVAANPKDADSLTMQGDLLQQSGQNDAAIKAYQSAIAANPQMDRAFVGLGKVYDQENQPDSAIAAYQSAIKVNPNNQDALLNAAQDSANNQHLADAETDLENYLKRYPTGTNESEVESQLSLIMAQPAK